jgi:hypothetical protein
LGAGRFFTYLHHFANVGQICSHPIFLSPTKGAIMAKIVTVFTRPESELQEMEDAASLYHTAIGPFSEGDEAKLTEFLATKLHRLRAICHKGTHHQLSLFLKPRTNGWLIEQINRHSHQGLNSICLSSLVLDFSDYKGSLTELSKEAMAFSGKKFLWHKIRAAKSLHTILNQIDETDLSGIYLGTSDLDEHLDYNLTVGHLSECGIYGLSLPVWTPYFKEEGRRKNAVFLGSRGHHANLDQLPKK